MVVFGLACVFSARLFCYESCTLSLLTALEVIEKIHCGFLSSTIIYRLFTIAYTIFGLNTVFVI